MIQISEEQKEFMSQEEIYDAFDRESILLEKQEIKYLNDISNKTNERV